MPVRLLYIFSRGFGGTTVKRARGAVDTYIVNKMTEGPQLWAVDRAAAHYALVFAHAENGKQRKK